MEIAFDLGSKAQQEPPTLRIDQEVLQLQVHCTALTNQAIQTQLLAQVDLQICQPFPAVQMSMHRSLDMRKVIIIITGAFSLSGQRQLRVNHSILTAKVVSMVEFDVRTTVLAMPAVIVSRTTLCVPKLSGLLLIECGPHQAVVVPLYLTHCNEGTYLHTRIQRCKIVISLQRLKHADL